MLWHWNLVKVVAQQTFESFLDLLGECYWGKCHHVWVFSPHLDIWKIFDECCWENAITFDVLPPPPPPRKDTEDLPYFYPWPPAAALYGSQPVPPADPWGVPPGTPTTVSRCPAERCSSWQPCTCLPRPAAPSWGPGLWRRGCRPHLHWIHHYPAVAPVQLWLSAAASREPAPDGVSAWKGCTLVQTLIAPLANLRVCKCCGLPIL